MEKPTQNAKRIKYMIEIDAVVDQVNDNSDIKMVGKLMAEGAGESTDNIKEYTPISINAEVVTVEQINCLQEPESEDVSYGDEVGPTY